MPMLFVTTLVDLTPVRVNLDILAMAKIALISMSASAVYTTATVQLHVQTL